MGAYALIAETDPARSTFYGDLVRAEGLEPVATRDGLEALDALKRRGAPALIVTDLSLPRADGFALLREARRLSPQEPSPAIVISAFRELRGAADTLRDHLGIKAILSKPVDGDFLRDAVKRALAGAATQEILPEDLEAVAALEESSRLSRIDSMGIVDDLPPDEALQELVRKTAEGFRVPVALVSLILKDRQWFKAHVGLSGEAKEARGTPREWAFCRHVVQGKAPLVVPDARSHPYFRANPLVKAGVVGSYAGAPLITPRGDVLGTLCIVDSKPLAISADEVEVLSLLARRVAGELEMRSETWRKAAKVAAPGAGAPASDLEMTLAYLDSAVLLLDGRGKILFVSPAFDELFERPASNEPGGSRDDFMKVCSAFFEGPEDFLRRTRVDVTGPYSGRETFRLRTPRNKLVRWTARPVPRGNGFAQLEVFTDITVGS
jgi:CheY-like chemotaxis protein